MVIRRGHRELRALEPQWESDMMCMLGAKGFAVFVYDHDEVFEAHKILALFAHAYAVVAPHGMCVHV